MRISDWSSDVCSSDLLGNINVFRTETRLIKGGASCKHCRRFAPLDRKRRRKHFKAVFWPCFHRCRPQPDLRPSQFASLFLGSKDQRHAALRGAAEHILRSEEHTSELQSLMRISYAVFCLKKKNKQKE